jgi:sugar phosphate permease
MFGNWIAPMLLRKVKDERNALALCQFVIAIGIITAAITGFPLSLALFFLHEAGRGSFQPIKDAYLHENIPSRERATIESFESIAHHGGGMIGLLLSGLLAFRAGISITWIASGTVLIIATLLVMKNGKK